MRVNARSRLSWILSWIPLLTAIPIAPASARYIPPCAAPSGVSVVTLLSAAPPALVRALIARVGEVVEPDEPFDVGDVDITGHHRRLIFIWHNGLRWIVATEYGGRGYADPIFAYDLRPDAQDATLVAERVAQPSIVCTTASGLLHFDVGEP